MDKCTHGIQIGTRCGLCAKEGSKETDVFKAVRKNKNLAAKNPEFRCDPMNCPILQCGKRAYWVSVGKAILAICEDGHVTRSRRYSVKELRGEMKQKDFPYTTLITTLK